jgi:hypothetical protein
MDKNGTKIIKLFLGSCFLFLFLVFSVDQVQAQPRKVRQAQRKAEKVSKQEKKEYDKRRKAALKHRYEIQTKETRERMKETEKRSAKYGRKQKEPFYKNLFKKRKKRKKRKKIRR